ncbi:hypothetical protein PWT90_05949 [Aphanocladium album]|nr:hypothetical protein PWT90_05949 [Aphanocladium album]
MPASHPNKQALRFGYGFTHSSRLLSQLRRTKPPPPNEQRKAAAGNLDDLTTTFFIFSLSLVFYRNAGQESIDNTHETRSQTLQPPLTPRNRSFSLYPRRKRESSAEIISTNEKER